MTDFTIASPAKVLIECGIACNKQGSDCNAFYVKKQECHLLEVGSDDKVEVKQ